ncbi:MAG: hypothetical protein AAF986_04610 [Pseudomonadota bacterium]
MKLILGIIAVILILVGITTVFLPIPIGLLCLLVGVALLTSVNEPFRDFLKWLRRKIRPVDKVFDKAEDVLPDTLAKPLHETDPDDEGEEEEANEKASSAKVDVRVNAAVPLMVRRPAYPRALPSKPNARR